jgi:amino acid adenylation domain-containing protein
MNNSSPDITDLAPEQQALAAPMLAEEGGDFDTCPLSFAQERLWFLDQLEPGNPLYNVPLALSLEGPLDPGTLARVLTEIARRHESLRTTFTTYTGQPVQVVAPARAVAVARLDLSELPPGERAAGAQRACDAEAQRSFDLARGPLWRALLLRLSAEEHILLLTMHHIVVDGWSIDVLSREAGVLYAAFSQGLPSPLEELSIQYADYAIWQREWLQGAALEEQLAYWRAQLAGAPPVLELPTDRPRPAHPTLLGATLRFELSAKLTQEVNALSRRAGVTPFMTLLAAWQLLLARYTGQTDIAVGVPVANRQRSEVEGLIGFFVNTLVLRTDLGGDPNFIDLLGRVRETALGAYAHQDLPFEKLVEELQPARSLSHAPLFQVAFNFRSQQHSGDTQLSAHSVRLSRLPVDRSTAKFDLSLNVADSKADYRCVIEYSTELFDEATIERLSGHFKLLLEGIVANPASRIAALPLLTPAERQQLLGEWNDTRRDYPRAAGLHALFEAQAAARPDAVAVVYADGQLTYGELNARANQLAHYLISLGVGPEVVVGICMERAPELIVGLLGILKAGGAYLPLDPAHPRARLSFMLTETGARLLLTQQRLRAALPNDGPPVISLDADWPAIARAPVENPGVRVCADNLAYVAYTSGSTGRPRGVAVTQRGVARLVKQSDYAAFGPAEVVLQFAPIAFDASTFEVWGSLLNGARLVLMPPGAQTLAELGQTLQAHGVTTLWLTAGLFHLMMDEHADDLRGVRQLLAGGDVLSPAHVQKFLHAADPGGTLINGYGPTENTTFTCCHPMRAGTQLDRTVPIGRPVAQTQVYVLDADLQPVPVGVTGELYAGGDGLARAYVNRPELTAERFIPHPFSAEPGQRLYRTGDLARYRPDGTLEFLGRRDGQVKVRGFRIELGEVEAALTRHEGVGECVVVARAEEGDKHLVGYVVAAAGAHAPSDGALRVHLKELLPDYMIPTSFVCLDALPLTPNGKVDRNALPAPDQTRPASGAEFVAPRTPVEELLAALWCQVLRVERVGIEDNFFEAGGHSLLATQLMARVSAAFRVELPLRTLFESPTVAGLAMEVEVALRSGQNSPPPPAPLRADRTKPIPLSFAQERLWFLEQFAPGSSVYHIPAAVRLEGRLDTSALELALRALAQRHESLRTSFRAATGGEPAQVVAEQPDFQLLRTDLRAWPASDREPEARRLAGDETQRPFDLARGPLWRALLLRLGDEEHVLLLTMHHIISDGWSMGVLVRELAALYASCAAGAPAPLPELPMQYADYAVWQREFLRGAELERQLAYWRKQLAGAPPVLDLPTDRPRPPAQSFRGRTQTFALSHELSAALQALSRREGVTLFMTLLAAFQTLLARYSGQEDLVVGTPIAGRQRLETEGLIGLFVNTLVLRARLSGAQSFRALLQQVREVTLGAYAHQDVPFERLVEELQPERQLNRAPLFQVLFVLQNMPAPSLELPGLRLSATPADGATAKFDLTLAMQEMGGRLVGALNYATDLFDDATAARLGTHFENLLRAVVAAPDQTLAALPLLAAGERQQLLGEWNDTRRDYALDGCVHELFEAQAARTPDADALVYEDERLTYAELDARANQLAHHLMSLGVGPEARVGVLLERSPEMVVALLGVLKAGGAYVPLDPEYPRERLVYMAEDAGLAVLLTQARLATELPPGATQVVCLDLEWAAIATQPTQAPGVSVSADNLAYVIYTSGSTGRPKGAMLQHRGVCNRLLWMQDEYHLTAADRVLQKTPFSFDVSVWEFFWPLMTGAQLVLARPGGHQDAAYLVALIVERGITVLHFVPSMLQVFLLAERVESCRSLRLVVCSGEALPFELQERFFARLAAELHNLYGPTEASVDVSYWACRRADGATSVPIGRPIANTQLYILDKRLQPVPLGVAGELYIGGVSLARGYLNRSDLTAERFIPDPFSGVPGARLYRTGDLTRYRPDASIEYLGRLDHQVKVRGFRIELGEVEAALVEHAGVRAAIVLARADGAGPARLVAYVVGAMAEPGHVSELRARLRARLPEYMIPSVFVCLDELPLTPNGKVDRRALPEPGHDRPELARRFVEPRNEVEAGVAAMWAELLRVERVGVEDNFFELGGHSLLATQVVSRVREAFGVELPLRGLFEEPTVAGLAVAILQKQSEQLDEAELERLLSELEQSPD